MLGLGVTTIEQGLIFSIMVLGVYITYKILDFPDLSVDGTITLGAFVGSYFIVKDFNPFLATILASLCGALAGFVTGILHVHLRISNLLSGILVMFGLYSINLRIIGKSNIHLFNETNVFQLVSKSFSQVIIQPYIKVMLIILIVLVLKFSLDYFLKSKVGMILRTTGDNPKLVTSLGVPIGMMKIIGLMLSNGLVALSGALLAQYQGFADINMGIGTIIIGLASVIIGDALFGSFNKLKMTSKIIIGTLLYRGSLVIALQQGFNPVDLKLVTALIVIIALGINNHKGQLKFKKKVRRDELASIKSSYQNI